MKSAATLSVEDTTAFHAISVSDKDSMTHVLPIDERSSVGPFPTIGSDACGATIAVADRSAVYLRNRYVFDRVVAGLLLLVLFPLLLLLIVLVRLTSKGPAIYRQTRMGVNGELFTIYKFRSMAVDAERGSGAVWSAPGDPRVTPIGRLMRWSHLDELPQLINILRGEMALIGPRPERPELVENLTEFIPRYQNRLKVLPGVTGLAQVTLPPDVNLNSVQRKTILDCEYVATAGIGLDAHILFCTLLLGFGVQRKINVQYWESFA